MSKTSANKPMDTTVFRKDYQPFNFEIERVDLTIDLDDEQTLVTNHMCLKRKAPGSLLLLGDELELIEIRLNKKVLDQSKYHVQNDSLIVHDCPDHFELTITTRIYPQRNTKLSGLYRSNQLFCTQCEAEGFRRITFFADRPDVLTIFTTRISAEKNKYPVLLSNGNLLECKEDADGRHWVVFGDPFKKPSYLFALVAGDLACVSDEFTTQSGRKIALQIYVEKGNEEKCVHAMNSLKKAMRWDEEEYGREYDLDVYMIVAVSDFNMGAMENKGLNIFNSKYILACPETATDLDYADIEGVVGHEYFHNWTGNRITCRDWFQLSLKEGLTVFRDQEFSRDMNSRDVNRILDVKTLRNTQFPEDAGTMAHPVRPESYQEINNFYTATVYNKGAEVIRMQQTLLGKDGFRRGMDLYFQRHDGQAVTIDDFVAAMEDANHIDLGQFKRWYSQAGTPEVTVKSDYQDGQLTLVLRQTCRPTPECHDKKPFHIPIRLALYSHASPTPLQTEVLELRESEQTFIFSGLKEKPLVSLLRDFSAPVMLHISRTQEELIALLRYESDGFAKWDAAQSLSLQCLKKFYSHPDERLFPEPLLAAYEHVLHDGALDENLRAELLTPPGFEDAVGQFTAVDVDILEGARDFYRHELGAALFEVAKASYHHLWKTEHHEMNGPAYGRRKLRNLCLWLMMKGQESESLTICHEQFEKARMMTDKVASFALLLNGQDEGVREHAIKSFYQQWSKNDLVLDKWFSLQACSEAPGTLQRVQALLSHPAFNIKNPNKVRSLIGAFCQANPRHFHAKDGSGYAFLSDMIVKIDPYNPQVTSRLAVPFTRWQRFDPVRQKLMQEQLNYLSQHNLSKDLRELISKSLSD